MRYYVVYLSPKSMHNMTCSNKINFKINALCETIFLEVRTIFVAKKWHEILIQLLQNQKCEKLETAGFFSILVYYN